MYPYQFTRNSKFKDLAGSRTAKSTSLTRYNHGVLPPGPAIIGSYSALDHTQLECIQMMEGMISCTWAQISDLARERSPYANLKFAGYDRIRSGATLSL